MVCWCCFLRFSAYPTRWIQLNTQKLLRKPRKIVWLLLWFAAQQALEDIFQMTFMTRSWRFLVRLLPTALKRLLVRSAFTTTEILLRNVSTHTWVLWIPVGQLYMLSLFRRQDSPRLRVSLCRRRILHRSPRGTSDLRCRCSANSLHCKT